MIGTFSTKPEIAIPANPNTVSAISPPAAPHADFLLSQDFLFRRTRKESRLSTIYHRSDLQLRQ